MNGLVSFKIWYFILHLTFPDGQIEGFNPALPTEEACNHFMSHVIESFQAQGIQVDNQTPVCQSFDAWYEDGSI